MHREKILWLNWKDFQILAKNPYQQVSNDLSKLILKAGFTWSPVMNLNFPITLTPISTTPDILKQGLQTLLNLGFKLDVVVEEEASSENAFDVDTILKNVWGSLGVNQPYLEKSK